MPEPALMEKTGTREAGMRAPGARVVLALLVAEGVFFGAVAVVLDFVEGSLATLVPAGAAGS